MSELPKGDQELLDTLLKTYTPAQLDWVNQCLLTEIKSRMDATARAESTDLIHFEIFGQYDDGQIYHDQQDAKTPEDALRASLKFVATSNADGVVPNILAIWFGRTDEVLCDVDFTKYLPQAEELL